MSVLNRFSIMEYVDYIKTILHDMAPIYKHIIENDFILLNDVKQE